LNSEQNTELLQQNVNKRYYVYVCCQSSSTNLRREHAGVAVSSQARGSYFNVSYNVRDLAMSWSAIGCRKDSLSRY